MNQKPLDSKPVQRALRHAKCVRLCSDFDKFKLGAVIFTSKKVVTVGFNRNKSTPIQRKYDIYRQMYSRYRSCIHAEMMALTRLYRLNPNFKGSDYSILVYRERSDGSTAIARPCPACEKALRDAGITNVYYTGNNSLVYEKYEL